MGGDDHSRKVPQLLLSVCCLASNLSMALGHKVAPLGVDGQLLPAEPVGVAVGGEVCDWLLEVTVLLGLDLVVVHQPRHLMYSTLWLDP